jgi:hypothetical protein
MSFKKINDSIHALVLQELIYNTNYCITEAVRKLLPCTADPTSAEGLVLVNLQRKRTKETIRCILQYFHDEYHDEGNINEERIIKRKRKRSVKNQPLLGIPMNNPPNNYPVRPSYNGQDTL